VHALCTSAFVVVVSLVVAGCSSSSPRFRTAETTPERVIQEDDEFKFASKIKDEETREDDKKIDLTNIQKRLAQRPRPTTSYSNITPKSLNRDQVLLDVVSFLGTPYAFGGSSKNGIDCSGLTSHVYAAAANKKLPRSTREQFQVGAEVPKDDLQFGDLVFFSTTGSKPSHVGIYIEDDLFAHASVSYGVTFSSLESSYYKKRFVGARRVAE
jgi:cell wall-associated NlpC family hydrolase